MKIITAAVIKGGTGKTTTVAALAQAAHRDKKRVLAVDLDPQANLSFSLGADQNRPGSYQMLVSQTAQSFAGSQVQFINREDDAGDPGLRTSKLSYHPLSLLDKYTVTIVDPCSTCV